MYYDGYEPYTGPDYSYNIGKGFEVFKELMKEYDPDAKYSVCFSSGQETVESGGIKISLDPNIFAHYHYKKNAIKMFGYVKEEFRRLKNKVRSDV